MSEESEVSQQGVFPPTRWTLMGRLKDGSRAEAEEALEEICRTYWYPLYVYARRFGLADSDAKDTVQDLFVRLLDQDRMARADASRGRLRTFLVSSLRHVLANARERQQAMKRGGQAEHLSLDMTDAEDRYLVEVASGEATPERSFDRCWAQELMRVALEKLRDAYAADGKGEVFAALSPSLSEGDSWTGQEEAAARLNMNDGAMRVALHRLRKRYRDMLIAEMARTEGATKVDGELAQLLSLFEK